MGWVATGSRGRRQRRTVVLHVSTVTVTLLASYTYPLLSLPSVRGMGVQFGSFDTICQTAALVICPLLGSDQGIEPTCYSRNVDIAGTLIFQPCEFFSICGRRQVRVLVNGLFLTDYFPPNFSNMFCPRRRDFDDGDHDLSHPK